MSALGMRLALSRLKRAHGITIAPVTVPLAPPTQYNQIICGYATTLDIDLQHQKFRGWVFGNIRLQDPGDTPLYYKHDTSREVGTIQSLNYDQNGALLITATVTDPIARRANAFSIGATVLEYELVNTDTPDFYALIKRATLEEISLTDAPANIQSTVSSRRDVCAAAELYQHAASAIERISQMLTLIQRSQSCPI